MGKISDRLDVLARRCGDLSPIAGPVRDLLLKGNREMFLSGLEDTGQSVRPLAASTLSRRKGTGPRAVPMRENSRAVRDCVVVVHAGPGTLQISKAWPTFPEIVYVGRSSGFRQQDLEAVRGMLREHITK
jgi:hypothetical protein